MAEASSVSPSEDDASSAVTAHRYYCHVCDEDIAPVLPEYVCPKCSGGFIEQRSGNNNNNNNNNGSGGASEHSMAVDDPEDERLDVSATAGDASLNSAITQILSIGPLQTLLGGATSSSPAAAAGTAPSHGLPQRRYMTRQASRPTQQLHRQSSEQMGALGDIIDTLFSNLHNVHVNVGDSGTGGATVFTGQMPVQFQLHGNIGDYVWGNAELDRIMTQLLNQMDTSGPPPLDPRHIDRLPRVNITQQHVDGNMQCMVCFEDYTLDEPVRQLPCAHLYHNDCIVPWLELHGTCPVCRCTIEVDSAEPPAPAPSDSGGGGGGASGSQTTMSTADMDLS